MAKKASFWRRLQKISPWWIFVGALVLVVGVGAYTYTEHVLALRSAQELKNYENFPTLKSTDRITIVSPHLDDETLGLGGFIAQAESQGIPVSIIFVTNGDDYSFGADLQYRTGYSTPDKLIAYGNARQDEALRATAQLGVSSRNVYFLGMPDRGLKAILDEKDGNTVYKSQGTLQTSSPYARSFIPKLSYTRNALTDGLTQAINLTQPTYVFTTLPDDHHTDHAATAQFVQNVWPNLTNQPNLYFFLIHYSNYPLPKGYDTSYPLLPPDALKNRPWKVINLSASDLAKKQAAVDEYKSQLAVPFSGRLLKAFLRQNELVLPK